MVRPPGQISLRLLEVKGDVWGLGTYMKIYQNRQSRTYNRLNPAHVTLLFDELATSPWNKLCCKMVPYNYSNSTSSQRVAMRRVVSK